MFMLKSGIYSFMITWKYSGLKSKHGDIDLAIFNLAKSPFFIKGNLICHCLIMDIAGFYMQACWHNEWAVYVFW